MERRNHQNPGREGQGQKHSLPLLGQALRGTQRDHGINGGRISKLMIKVDGVITANYDRGWDVEPAEDDMPTRMAYCILLENYN